MHFSNFSRLLVIAVCLSACSTRLPQEATIGDLDIPMSEDGPEPVIAAPKQDADVKKAYQAYLASDATNTNARRIAMTRLAALEMKALAQLSESDSSDAVDIDLRPDYKASVERTIHFLAASIAERPDAKDNDRLLYQLSQNYEKLNRHDEYLDALTQLTLQYPQSDYYAEAQFRLGENAFVAGDYLTAEAAYTESIFTAGGNEFYDRSLLKRGWSRYRQGLFEEAVEDFVAAIQHRQFDSYSKLNDSDKTDFDEHFRALALAAINLDSPTQLDAYLSAPSDSDYLYHAYQVMGSLYLSKQRYADAIATLGHYIDNHPTSTHIPEAYLYQMDIYRKAKDMDRFVQAMNTFYPRFNTALPYWKGKHQTPAYRSVKKTLRANLLLVADFQQQAYRKTQRQEHFEAADQWYQRYLAQYAAYAQQDKVYIAYAELLTTQNRHKEALEYFEKAAYDGEIVLNKDAAYATISLADTLHKAQPENPTWVERLLTYSLRSLRLYPDEARYQQAGLHAVQVAYNNGRYAEAVAFADELARSADAKLRSQVDYVKGLALLKTNDLANAETVFSRLLTSNSPKENSSQLSDSLALAIYEQAQANLKAGNIDEAIAQYARVAKQSKNAAIAPDSLFQAISLAVKHERWNQAVASIELFQQYFPKHRLHADATRELSNAYLQLGRYDQAATVFETIAKQDDDQDVKMAALWRAATLYESKKNMSAAIRAYTTYANTYSTPYPQYLESMHKLSALYVASNNREQAMVWQKRILTADEKTVQDHKTARTDFIAADAALNLAKYQINRFESVRLVEPLARQLRDKKAFMKESIALLGRASSYNLADVTTEATYLIGKIYQNFSHALLNSERPKHLSDDELEQYDILLEDQAFPFEEKAIEFYEINMARTADGVHNPWIEKSYAELKTLFPSRYQRRGKFRVMLASTP